MKYTAQTRQEIDRAIHNASLANLTEAGAIDYVKEKTGIQITRTTLFQHKRSLKTARIKLWNAYRNNDYAYRIEHLQRIDEAKLVKDIAIEQIMKYRGVENKFFYLQKSAYLLLDANKRIAELTEMIPEIDIIGHSSQYEMDSSIPELQSTADGQIPTQSEAIF